LISKIGALFFVQEAVLSPWIAGFLIFDRRFIGLFGERGPGMLIEGFLKTERMVYEIYYESSSNLSAVHLLYRSDNVSLHDDEGR
jgi:hypothetical protein